MQTATKFESTTKAQNTTGNGRMLIVRGGNLITLGDDNAQVKTELGTGEDNAIMGTYEGNIPNKFDAAKLDQKLRMADGTLVLINETANIKRGFANVTVGELVRLVYGGKKKLVKGPNAGKFVHDFDVQRAINSDN